MCATKMSSEEKYRNNMLRYLSESLFRHEPFVIGGFGYEKRLQP